MRAVSDTFPKSSLLGTMLQKYNFLPYHHAALDWNSGTPAITQAEVQEMIQMAVAAYLKQQQSGGDITVNTGDATALIPITEAEPTPADIQSLLTHIQSQISQAQSTKSVLSDGYATTTDYPSPAPIAPLYAAQPIPGFTPNPNIIQQLTVRTQLTVACGMRGMIASGCLPLTFRLLLQHSCFLFCSPNLGTPVHISAFLVPAPPFHANTVMSAVSFCILAHSMSQQQHQSMMARTALYLPM